MVPLDSPQERSSLPVGGPDGHAAPGQQQRRESGPGLWPGGEPTQPAQGGFLSACCVLRATSLGQQSQAGVCSWGSHSVGGDGGVPTAASPGPSGHSDDECGSRGRLQFLETTVTVVTGGKQCSSSIESAGGFRDGSGRFAGFKISASCARSQKAALCRARYGTVGADLPQLRGEVQGIKQAQVEPRAGPVAAP